MTDYFKCLSQSSTALVMNKIKRIDDYEERVNPHLVYFFPHDIDEHFSWDYHGQSWETYGAIVDNLDKIEQLRDKGIELANLLNHFPEASSHYDKMGDAIRVYKSKDGKYLFAGNGRHRLLRSLEKEIDKISVRVIADYLGNLSDLETFSRVISRQQGENSSISNTSVSSISGSETLFQLNLEIEQLISEIQQQIYSYQNEKQQIDDVQNYWTYYFSDQELGRQGIQIFILIREQLLAIENLLHDLNQQLYNYRRQINL